MYFRIANIPLCTVLLQLDINAHPAQWQERVFKAIELY